MGLLGLFGGRDKLKGLLKDAPITYKLNDKGDTIQLFGQSYYRNDPTEIILNPDHTSVILYGNSGKNLYGIYGDGTLKTATWDKWTDKQFDNRDIASVHVSPFYTAYIELRFPNNTINDITLPKYNNVNNDGTITIEHNGLSGEDQLPIPQGMSVVSISMVQTTKKEYFGPVEVEPSADACKYKARSCFMNAFVIIVVALFIGLLFYLYHRIHRDDTVTTEDEYIRPEQ